MIKFLISFLVIFVPTVIFAADDDIPYDDNDKSYVVIPKDDSGNEDNGNIKILEKVDVKELSIPECKSVPIYLNRCIPGICMDKTQFGKVFRKIKGTGKDGVCNYVERTPGYGGVDCSFPQDKLEKINSAFHTYYFGMNPDDSTLSPNDLEDFKTSLSNNCKIVKDSALTSAVSIDTDQSHIIDPEFKDAANLFATKESTQEIAKVSEPEKIVEVVTKEPVVETQTVVEKPAVESTPVQSVMFTPEEIEQINSILNSFNIDSGISKVVSTKEDFKKESRNFYLNSIIYYTDNKWSVWVNGQKISSNLNDKGLIVKEIGENYVVLEWSTPSLEKISPNWKSVMTTSSGNKFYSAKKDIEIYLPDETTAVVSFRLSPNQTFEVSNMKIKEGAAG